MPTIERRVVAVQATYDLFHGKPMAWGKHDCVRMVGHLLKGLGYKPRLHRGGAYSNELGAVRALKRAGFNDTAEAMDDMGFLRIAPARCLAGDVMGFRMQGEKLTALAVCVGQGRVLGFLSDGVCHAVTPSLMVEGGECVAWGCPPWPR